MVVHRSNRPEEVVVVEEAEAEAALAACVSQVG